ncbi:hypothetical protein GCM10025857_62680 [Alicyclobacillus contaminans]|uniref:UTP--glucose-1-phosphate uridylyltransferase n=1 Tax=Tetragenococcus osmophilus TaxID=526944 RepID=A0AA38CXD4_9ENTE|nr:hypothetical protein GCM10025857_62680 [Alicyclobacillus contaminans]GMA71290.1 hypothetical protein GCM10025885_03390 [Tetragenococcus osmophilus]
MFAREFRGKRFDVGDKFGFMKTSIEYGLVHPQIKDDLSDYIIELGNQLNQKKQANHSTENKTNKDKKQ